VAAHEVSHAVQHARGEKAFAVRFDLVRKLNWVDRLASGILLLAPVVFMVIKAPALLVLQVVAGLLLLAIRIVVHVATLPVELDASFGKALPVLVRGRYISPGDLPAARSVLTAAAWTYVAAALATLLDVARWFRILRF
jgi:Zn-dependent membrane protease YugP